ncbi:hypothetical protein [Pseudomonas sp. MH9.3]|uniref:hypothetical protein n=1 Tax=Pseudomonas sp. MH9.3 TaxID=3048630 RepID=UPI002AC8DD52|nr:hypothetical protein [Pseudomonas sp. MH9.3]MEB0106110.1 hypothetical protein [Pseudomonas sp. MH9.3]WPX80408.1 hypothetical protein RHM60_04650 [Pseudomonas sp. MH9.3]WQG57652.1 hypothetical protein RHM66_22180 [Pseudomonas sp. RTB3]
MTTNEDTSKRQGCSTPLEMNQRQCALLEDELTNAYQLLSKARANVADLARMNDLLVTGKANADTHFRLAMADLGRSGINGSQMIASQNVHLRVENHRLLELTLLKGA